MEKILRALVISLLVTSCMAADLAAATRENVLSRGYLQCGVSTGLPGFSFSDENGNWIGFDVDICRAVAAATLGDATKVRYIPLAVRESFTALQAGDVDILIHDLGWTLTRDTALGVSFVGISYFDHQGMMVKNGSDINNFQDLEDNTVCVLAGTTVELNVADLARQRTAFFRQVVVDTPDQMLKGFDSGRCEAVAGNIAHLQALRSRLPNAEEAVFLDGTIGREVAGPVVRQGDDAWLNIVKWTLYALIDGEALGLTSGNVLQLKASGDPEKRRFLGLEGIKGEGLGLADDWAARIILQVGNYGEIFERNLGRRSQLNLERGDNALWSNGGLLYAPPFR